MVQNLYTQLLTDGPKKVVDYIEHLDAHNQIDHDEYGEPIVVSVSKQSSLIRVGFQRNGYCEHFLINPRSRKTTSGIVEPMKKSWNSMDGWKRPDQEKKKLVEPEQNPRKERSFKEYHDMVEVLINADRRRLDG